MNETTDVNGTTDVTGTTDVNETTDVAAGGGGSLAAYEPTAAQPAPMLYFPFPDPPRRDRRRLLRTILRWTGAVTVFGGLFAGTAVAVTLPARTDVPGLATPGDGRLSYPPLSLPTLPPGAVTPQNYQEFSGTQVGHAADLRRLLLPVPVGATLDKTFPGSKGWLPVDRYEASLTSQQELEGLFHERGVRHIAATAWTLPDHTRAEVYLVAFRSAGVAQRQTSFDAVSSAPKVLAPVDVDSAEYPAFKDVALSVSVKSRAAKGGKPAARVAVWQEEDVEVLLVMTGPERVGIPVFEQAVLLQHELLGG